MHTYTMGLDRDPWDMLSIATTMDAVDWVRMRHSTLFTLSTEHTKSTLWSNIYIKQRMYSSFNLLCSALRIPQPLPKNSPWALRYIWTMLPEDCISLPPSGSSNSDLGIPDTHGSRYLNRPLGQFETSRGAKTGFLGSRSPFSSANCNTLPYTTASDSDGDGRYTPVVDRPVAPWRIHWLTPASIAFLFFLGVGTAVAHHRYYLSLDKTRAGTDEKQRWVIRVGTGLAILFRASLVALVGISRKQWVWVTLRKRFISLNAINAIFGATGDPLHFGNIDMIRRARIATAMAAVMWAVPLTAVFTLDTLTVQPGSILNYTAPCDAPTVRFDFDSESTATRNPLNLSSLDPIVDRYRGIYHAPSTYARNLFTIAAFGEYLSRDAVTFVGCPEAVSWCEYNTTMVLPSVDCMQEAYPEVSAADWETPALWRDLFDNAIPEDKIPVFVAQRDRENRNTLWIAYIYREYGTEILRPSLISCRNSITRYQLESTAPQSNAPKGDFISLWPNTAEQLLFVGENGDTAHSAAESSEYDGSYALFDTFTEILTGSILRDRDPSPYAFEDLSSTTTTTLTRVESTSAASNGRLFAMETAFILDGLSTMALKMGTALILRRDHEFSATTTTTCRIFDDYNVYAYASHKLLITYGVVIAVGFVMAGIGLAALGMNGVASDTSFSTVLLTTRNPSLDRLTAGGCIGGKPLPVELGKLMLKFGELATENSADGVGHTAMGVEGEVSRIRRRGKYS